MPEPGRAVPEKGVHGLLGAVQDRVALMPDYAMSTTGDREKAVSGTDGVNGVDHDASLAGLLGGLISLVFAGLIGIGVRRKNMQPVAETDFS